MDDTKKILVFAAHPDDFAYSLAGAQQVYKNIEIHLIDVFTQSVFWKDHVYSEENAPWVTEKRKLEEVNFCQSNNIQVTFLDFPDSSLRGFQDYFKTKQETQFYALVRERIENLLFLADFDILLRPLSLGGHMDHVMLDLILTELLSNMTGFSQFFYEDLPYASEMTESQLQQFVFKKSNGTAKSKVILYDTEILLKKIEGLSKFSSQITLEEIKRCNIYAKRISSVTGFFAERIWRF